jgi:hydroxyethylthiazole kinase-like uncharacterized protein yjeF
MQIKIVTIAEMKAIEVAADKSGLSFAMMMDSAGQAVAENILARVTNAVDQKIVVLCGTGNNGGDGLVAANRLAEAGASVAVYALKPLDETDVKVQRLREKDLLVVDAENDQRWRVLKNLIGGVTVLVDAVFGTGARLPMTGRPADLFQQVARLLEERSGEPPLRVAVDCPSGLDCDTGALDPHALAADLTVTFAAAKRGHFAFPGADAVGELVVADIGINDLQLPEFDNIQVTLATGDLVRRLLPPRPRNAHKGTFGRVLVAAGSVNYTGAAFLSASAAYRVGAGLVTLAVVPAVYGILAGHLPEATWLMLPHEQGVIAGSAAEILRANYNRTQALLVGPGLGMERETADFVRRWLGADEANGQRRSQFGFVAAPAAQSDAENDPLTMPPAVVDADGLKLMAQVDGWAQLLPRNSVLTPHPGEMAVLTGLDKDTIEADRIGTAQKYAAEWAQVVVLKGAYTVVAAPDGRTVIQPFATAALARAGTGDVLAGAIAGLLAQKLLPFEAAVAAGYLHGHAGVLVAQAFGTTASVLASDILEGLIEALADLGN